MPEPDPIGHTIPALVLSSYSLLIYLSVLRNYFGKNRSEGFRTAASYKLPNGFPLEAYLKVLTGLMGVFGFWLAPSTDSPENKLHHTLIVIAFALSGITDLLVFYGWNLPCGTQYLMLTFFHAICAFSISFHLHGGPVIICLHTLLSLIIILATMSCLIEWKYSDNILAATLRPYFVLFASTWLLQITYYSMENMENIKEVNENVSKTFTLIPCLFMLHSIACILIMAFIAYVFSKNCVSEQRGNYFKINREFIDD